MAALKAGIDRKTARKYLKLGKMPEELKKERHWRTRHDPFEAVWPTLEAMLTAAPGLEARTLMEWLMTQDKGNPPVYQMNQLRTLQRKIREWRAVHGPEKEVFFRQNIQPGKQSQSDYTSMNSLGICIAGKPFDHLLFHFMLPYSRWETVSVCHSESFDSLSEGYTEAVFELGAVPPEHRTDNLSAATHSFGSTREFNSAWREVLAHYRVVPSRNNPGEGHENGSVEKSHHLFKNAVEQQLLLRGSKDFASVEAYVAFLKQIVKYRNHGREERLAQEMAKFLPLPEKRWRSVRTFAVTVSPSSTITVLKGTYSVPSRLVGYGVTVNLYANQLEVCCGKKVLETMPRLPKDRGNCINYRHIITYLLRKPGAFAQYQHRESLFPRTVFRAAHDLLVEQNTARGHKEYLQLLHLAAIESESEVATALEVLIEAKKMPFAIAVKELLYLPKKETLTVYVTPPDLAAYDILVKQPYDAQKEVSYAAY